MADAVRIAVVETTARQGGLALALGAQVIAATKLAVSRDYASDLLPALDGLCSQAGWGPADIQQVFVSVGPGSFTGARIGVTFAKTLAMATGARVVAVPTLLAAAQNALDLDEPPVHLAIVIDARRRQVYAETFRLLDDRSGYEPSDPGRLLSLPELLAAMPRPAAVAGEDLAAHRPAIEAAGARLLPEALSVPRVQTVHRIGWRMAVCGEFADADRLVPRYFRLPTPVERLRAADGDGHARFPGDRQS